MQKIKVYLDIFSGPYMGEIQTIEFLQQVKGKLFFDSPIGEFELSVHQLSVFKELISLLNNRQEEVVYEFKTEYGSILEENPNKIWEYLTEYLNSIK